jgi:hypothetical protein
VRNLEVAASKPLELEIEESMPVVLDDWSLLKDQEDGRYCRPRRKGNKSVDSGMQPEKLFQVTVSKDHPLNCAGLKEGVDNLRLKKGMKAQFYWVLPPDRFIRC